MHHNLTWLLLLVTCFPLSSPQCPTPAIATSITKLHNQIRQAVAKQTGSFGDNKTPLNFGGKGSKSLFALFRYVTHLFHTYDSSLEGVAMAAIDTGKCQLNKELVSQLGMAVNFGKNRDAAKVGFAYAIEDWLDTAELPLSATYNPSDPDSEKFANMVYYKSLRLGCCSLPCTVGTNLKAYACAYSATPQKGQPLYIEESTKKGCVKKSCKALVSNADCNNKATCDDTETENCCGLCTTADGSLDTTTAIASSTPQTSPPLSSTQAETTPTLSQEISSTSQAPSSLTSDEASSPSTSAKSPSSSAPGQSTLGQSTPGQTTPGQASTSKGSGGCMTDDIRNQVVNAFNEKRAALAKGKVQNGPAGGKPNLRSATNMYRMSYDTALENEAQTYTNTCPPGKSELSTRTGHGETITILDDKSISCENALKNATDTWWNEITLKALNDAVKYTQVLEQSAKAPTNFTQMAWAASYKVGCGVSNCNYGTIVVCRYYVRGNIYSQYIYRIGTTCASCSSSCNDGLCKAPN